MGTLAVGTNNSYVWLRMMFTRCASSEFQFSSLREVLVLMVARERQGHCHGKPGWQAAAAHASVLLRVLLGRAPDSARTEGSSIIDEPGEC